MSDAEKRLARLCAAVSGDGLLSEGQIAKIIGDECSRVEVRILVDEGRALLAETPVSGEWGKHLMTRIS